MTGPAVHPAPVPPATASFLRDPRWGRALVLANRLSWVWVSVLLVLGYVFFDHHLPSGAPLGIVLYGAIVGGITGLLSLGLVLVYKANRVINFAQAELGAFALLLSFELISTFKWPFAVAVPISIAAAIAVGAGVEYLVIRRFANAPRLTVAVATIGLATVLLALQLIMPLLFQVSSDDYSLFQGTFPSPLHFDAFQLSGFRFKGDSVLAMITLPVIVVGLALFFSRSWVGIGIRAAAENRDRAGLLGVSVGRLSTIAWALAAGLSATAAILRAPITGFQPGDLAGPGLLVEALAAAAIGGFESLPRTFVAAMVIGVVDQVYVFNYANGQPLDAIVLVITLVAFLAQRRKISRSVWSEASSWQAFKEVRAIPDKVRNLAEIRLARANLPLLGIALVIVLPQVLDVGHTLLVSTMFLFGMVAISLVILSGWAGQISLGQYALVGIGGFTAGRLSTGEHPPSFIAVLVIVGAVGAALSLVIGLPAFRIRGLFLGVTTLAFAVAASSWFFQLSFLQPQGPLQRPVLFGHQLTSQRGYYYLCFGALVLTIIAAVNLRRSRVGRVLIAARDNEQAAQAYGVNLIASKLTAFAVSGAIAAIAGALYVFTFLDVRASDYAPDTSLLIFATVVIGGMGSIQGALLATVYVRGAQYFLPDYGPLLATGVGMLLVLLFIPDGLGGLAFRYRDRAVAWVARRRGIDLRDTLSTGAETELLATAGRGGRGWVAEDEPAPLAAVAVEASAS